MPLSRRVARHVSRWISRNAEFSRGQQGAYGGPHGLGQEACHRPSARQKAAGSLNCESPADRLRAAASGSVFAATSLVSKRPCVRLRAQRTEEFERTSSASNVVYRFEPRLCGQRNSEACHQSSCCSASHTHTPSHLQRREVAHCAWRPSPPALPYVPESWHQHCCDSGSASDGAQIMIVKKIVTMIDLRPT